MLDLKSEDGRAALTELVRRSDVLLENFRPGVLDRLGFTMERLTELNPALVVLSISGFGHDGPEGGRAGYDQIAQGEAGLMSMTGPDPQTPTKVGVPISDLLAGMYGAYGVVAKLHERASTGRGGLVRTSLLASVVGVHAYQGTRWTVAGEIPQGRRPASSVHLPLRAVPLRRRHRADRRRVRGAVGPVRARVRHPGATGPEFSTNPDRVRNSAVVRAAVETGLRRLLDARPAGEAVRRSACPVARSRTCSRSTTGTRPARRACSSTSSTRCSVTDPAARPAVAVLRIRRRRNGTARTPLRRRWASTPTKC